MKNRQLVIGALIAVVLIAALVLFLRRPPGPKPPVPQPRREAVLKPRLTVTPTRWQGTDAGSLEEGDVIAVSEPIDLRVAISGRAYVYLWDDFDNVPELMAPPMETPWEAGEYSAESPTFSTPGTHRLVVVANPVPITHPEEWRALQPDIVASGCPSCEFTSLTLLVTKVLDGGVLRPEK